MVDDGDGIVRSGVDAVQHVGVGLGVGHVVQVVIRSFQQLHQVSGRARLEPIIAEPHILEGIQQAERVIDTRYVGYEMIAVVTLSQQGVCFIIGQFEGGGQFMGISVLANLLEILYTDWDK